MPSLAESVLGYAAKHAKICQDMSLNPSADPESAKSCAVVPKTPSFESFSSALLPSCRRLDSFVLVQSHSHFFGSVDVFWEPKQRNGTIKLNLGLDRAKHEIYTSLARGRLWLTSWHNGYVIDFLYTLISTLVEWALQRRRLMKATSYGATISSSHLHRYRSTGYRGKTSTAGNK